MAVMVGQWKNFNNDNSGEFVLPHPSFKENLPELLLLKFFSLTISWPPPVFHNFFSY